LWFELQKKEKSTDEVGFFLGIRVSAKKMICDLQNIIQKKRKVIK
jgi:hypothetical protein